MFIFLPVLGACIYDDSHSKVEDYTPIKYVHASKITVQHRSTILALEDGWLSLMHLLICRVCFCKECACIKYNI